MLKFRRNKNMCGRWESDFMVESGYFAKYIVHRDENGKWWLRMHSEAEGRYVYPAWGWKVHGRKGASSKMEIQEFLNGMAYETASVHSIAFNPI